ncbi:MAG: cytochrome bc1 complex diheme cytochrome c subunit [Acidimicrobiales bacterium]
MRRGAWRVGPVLAIGVLASLAVVPAARAQPEVGPVTAADGERLYATGCSTCHGLRGEGSALAPTLQGVGAASVDFYLASGRMPLDNPDAQAVRKPPAFDRAEIDAIVAHVTSFGPGGPPVPVINPASADLADGGELYRSNCAACHGAAGIGGALAYGTQAPTLHPASSVQVAEAMRIGPGSMPVFGADILTDDQVQDIVRYVSYLDDPDDRGGFGLGHAGPIPEGFVGWLVGLGLLVGACWWIGERE